MDPKSKIIVIANLPILSLSKGWVQKKVQKCYQDSTVIPEYAELVEASGIHKKRGKKEMDSRLNISGMTAGQGNDNRHARICSLGFRQAQGRSS